MTRISIIVAMGRDRTIGKDNQMPWHLPSELAYFRRTTMGHPIIMGRKTHESIGKALDGRKNIVVTRDRRYESEGCIIVHGVEEALQQLEGEEEAFVIGGAAVIQLFLHVTDRLYLTYIDEDFAGDVFFPELPDEEWLLLSTEPGITNEKNPHRYEYRVYDRRKQI